ncbi:hypothetical protein BN1723_003815 [Verticillium longisporum]|uniref:Zn(2)-C6 fungal-type domain-containing protein n=1 Tax=Verticillium longisporum TaxID=100787 RepID=A0A0G4MCW3_VERLO|nr:hypothetical protein BN1723_003815 [Verticillium longisporum]
MPSKRKTNDVETNPTSTSGPVKRQRVSRACDQCRSSAREKCDGIQPQCFACVSLNRECTYNVAPKKRGVQTGLIRTLESALVWVFEQFPGTEAALNDLLTQESGPESLLIGKGSEAGNRLHRRWRKSKTCKEIDRLLSGRDGSSPRIEGSEEDESSTEADQLGQSSGKGRSVPSTNDTTANPANRSYKLPNNCSRLLDIYLAYTHSWLPIVDRSRLLNLVAARHSDEIRDAELWSALAVAAYQDPSHTTDPSAIYSTARSLLPLIGDSQAGFLKRRTSSMTSQRHGKEAAVDGGDQAAEELAVLQHANAFLLLSLVDLGQDKPSNASLYIGLAVRTAMGLRDLAAFATPQSNHLQTRTVRACFLLDTIVSVRMGHTSHLTPASLDGLTPISEEGPEEWDSWAPEPGFGSDVSIGSGDSLQSVQSLSSFNQLCRFARILGKGFAGTHTPRSAELAAALDPRFSFCNSILGGSTPFLPTAFLLQTTFLGAALALNPEARVSLVWTLLEAVENAWQHLGPGTSPLLITFMGMANRRTKGLGGEDKERWDSLMTRLKATWQRATEPSQVSSVAPPAPNLMVYQNHSPAHRHSLPVATLAQQSQEAQPPQQQYHALLTPSEHYPTSTTSFLGGGTAASPSTSRSIPFTPGSNQIPGYSAGMMSPMLQMPHYMLLPGHESMIDHDAILDELAAIDCTDSMDADPQFMANLGFAPGSDFTDMRGEFGAL